MSIPNAARDAPPPPPLPPPRHIEDFELGQDQGWKWANEPPWGGDAGRVAAVKPGSSLLGGRNITAEKDGEERAHNEIDAARRGSSISTVIPKHELPDEMMTLSDEDGSSSRPPSNYRLQSERQLEQMSLEGSSRKYDSNLLKNLGGPNTPHRLSISYQSPGSRENASVSPGSAEGQSGQLKPLSMPERRHPSWDGSSRWNNLPSSGAVSPGSLRSPLFDPDFNRPSAQRHPSFPFDDSSSHRGSYDAQSMSGYVHDEFSMEEGQMKDLNIHDRSPSGSVELLLGAKAGMKRRASSPHQESTREDRTSVSSAPGDSDLYHRRSMQQLTGTNRVSPIPRYPHHGSVSSVSSYGRNGSLASSYGPSLLSVASSATSHSSGRISPSALSPAIDPELGVGTPYAVVPSLNPSPRASLSLPTQQRTVSDASQTTARQISIDDSAHSRQDSISTPQIGPPPYMCECCPKKPKKFNTHEELQLHLMEKQYTCAYCSNRFKNKNEAERHQNSLHLRRHSWSCAALPNVEAAFHTSIANGGATDVCGYCGQDFPNPAQWDVRREHINQTHKFGECNQAKKFYRADHFRQHLKHSHGGASGKWTNMLETACMREEPLPTPLKERPPAQAITAANPAQAPPAPTAPMIAMQAVLGASDRPEVIDEVPHET